MPTLIDTLRSGNAWKVRLMAGLIGLPLTRRTLSIDRGDLHRAEFRALAPLGQVPVLLPDFHDPLDEDFGAGDDAPIAESMAILRYLARGTPWWPEDALAQARVLTWLSFEQDRHMKPLALLRLHLALRKDRDPWSEEFLRHADRAREALLRLEGQLRRQGPDRWVATADHPSIADVALYPYTRMAPMGGIALSPYPAILGWLARIEALPGYQPLFPGQPERNLATEERA